MTIEELKIILDKVYDKDTAHPMWRVKWSKSNPTYGQCVPTALLVQYYFGGEIYKHNLEQHYFNLINGEVVDLTKEQFNYMLDYSNSKSKQPNLEISQTLERYELLKKRVEIYIKENNYGRRLRIL